MFVALSLLNEKIRVQIFVADMKAQRIILHILVSYKYMNYVGFKV